MVLSQLFLIIRIIHITRTHLIKYFHFYLADPSLPPCIHAYYPRVPLLCTATVHVLNESRGACVEGTVTRCKMVQSTFAPAVAAARAHAPSGGEALRVELQCAGLPPIATMRLLALSATVPNLGDIAEWLDAKSFGFGPQYRYAL